MKTYRAGIDIGSTTVKLVLLDENDALVYGRYRRHNAHVQDSLAGLLHVAKETVGSCDMQIKITGSGSINLGRSLGIEFVQEVAAVAAALQRVPRKQTSRSSWAERTQRSCTFQTAWKSV